MKITYLIFSSIVPFVNNTRPHSNSLKAIPFAVPPQAVNNQSAMASGTPSHNTSCMNAFLLNVVQPAPEQRLNASFIRCSSASVTIN